MTKTAKIAEIFDSIQGEGPYIGYRQLFIRFCGCNLLCDYCDTEFDKGDDYSVFTLIEKIKTFDIKVRRKCNRYLWTIYCRYKKRFI